MQQKLNKPKPLEIEGIKFCKIGKPHHKWNKQKQIKKLKTETKVPGHQTMNRQWNRIHRIWERHNSIIIITIWTIAILVPI